jgi:2-isopropylmalate synthase
VKIAIYDATLTEGAREAGIQLSVRDKLRIALRLAGMGVSFVEGGWPGGRSSDAEIFREARRLELGGARLCACATLSLHGRATGDSELKAALRSGAPAVTLSVSVAGGRGAGGRAASHLGAGVQAIRRAKRSAIVELEGFFDAVREGAGPALTMVEQAATAGAEAILLSDTAGGALPNEVEAGVVASRRAAGHTAIGVRARDDAGLAVANSLAAVGKGATLLAATVNGYGERCGAADLIPIAAALELKMGHRALAPGQLKQLTSLAHFVAEIADREAPRDQPYAGRDAFSVARGGATPHVDPEAVGNRAEAAMADERGHPSALRVARALGLPARGEADARRVLDRLAEWERRGFRYEGAEASFDLLLRALAGRRRKYFEVLAYRVLDVHRERKSFTEATVEVAVGREHLHTAAIGVGPVNALDRALRRALERHYPELSDMQLVQSRSRNLSSGVGTAGPVRVLIESADGRDRWGTAGVSDDLIDACCQSLVDAIEYKLTKDDVQPRPAGKRGRSTRIP